MKKALVFFSTSQMIKQAKIMIESFCRHNNYNDTDFIYVFCGITEALNKKLFSEKTKIIPLFETHPKALEAIKKYGHVGGVTRVMAIHKTLSLGYDKVLCLDSDMMIYDDISEIWKLLDNYNAIVTPHYTIPLAHDGLSPDMSGCFFAGNYNAGFFACRNNSAVSCWLEWWLLESLNRGQNDLSKGLAGEQSWLRFIADLLDNVLIWRHPGYNVAYWNIVERGMKRDEKTGKIFTQSLPLKIMHFSGFQPDNPAKMSGYQNRHKATGEILDIYQGYANILKNTKI